MPRSVFGLELTIDKAQHFFGNFVPTEIIYRFLVTMTSQ